MSGTPILDPISLDPKDVILNQKGAPVISPAPTVGYGPGSIVGQTPTQVERRQKVMDLWMGGASYREIKDTLGIGSFLTIQRDIEFNKDVLIERFASELSDKRAVALQRLEFVVEEALEGLSTTLPLSTTDKVKLMNVIMKSTELKAKIEGVLDGQKSTAGQKAPQKVVYVVDDSAYRHLEQHPDERGEVQVGEQESNEQLDAHVEEAPVISTSATLK